jgi:hypothetical protein
MRAGASGTENGWYFLTFQEVAEPANRPVGFGVK